MKVTVLASGSRGNCTVIEQDGFLLMIDAGLSARRIEALCSSSGIHLEDLAAILLTHEHDDHVRGVGPLARKLKVPVYSTAMTFGAARKQLKELPARETFEPGRPLRCGPFLITPLPVPHDAACPVAPLVSDGQRRFALVTDLGCCTNSLLYRLRGCHAVLLEANYDPTMLMEGGYPWKTKQRIMGRHGHLSNIDACRVIERLGAAGGLERVVLGHVSENNNSHEAVLAAYNKLVPEGLRRSLVMEIASQDSPLETFVV